MLSHLSLIIATDPNDDNPLTITVDKNNLAQSCPYFQSMLAHFRESNESVIRIIYPNKNVFSDRVKNLCGIHIDHLSNPDNLVDVMLCNQYLGLENNLLHLMSVQVLPHKLLDLLILLRTEKINWFTANLYQQIINAKPTLHLEDADDLFMERDLTTIIKSDNFIFGTNRGQIYILNIGTTTKHLLHQSPNNQSVLGLKYYYDKFFPYHEHVVYATDQGIYQFNPWLSPDHLKYFTIIYQAKPGDKIIKIEKTYGYVVTHTVGTISIYNFDDNQFYQINRINLSGETTDIKLVYANDDHDMILINTENYLENYKCLAKREIRNYFKKFHCGNDIYQWHISGDDVWIFTNNGIRFLSYKDQHFYGINNGQLISQYDYDRKISHISTNNTWTACYSIHNRYLVGTIDGHVQIIFPPNGRKYSNTDMPKIDKCFKAHNDSISSISYYQNYYNYQHIVTTGSDGLIKIWSGFDGDLKYQINANAGQITCFEHLDLTDLDANQGKLHWCFKFLESD